MKKLFDKATKRRDKDNTLVGKVVMVGQHSVRVEAILGEGGYSTVYRVCSTKDGNLGQVFALKHLRLAADTDAIKEVQQEAKAMARLKGHPNILRLHAVAFAGPPGAETDGFFLLDFCPVNLLDVMQKTNFELDDFLVYEVFHDVCHAVAYMHKCNPPLAHRDLKAENVLKNSEGRWVICDFGSSTTRAQTYESAAEIAQEEEHIRRTTTPAYRAPEMWDLYQRHRIDSMVDIWALGVLLYVLAFGKLPFPGDSKLAILYGKYDMPPGRPPAMRTLIQDMLQVTPSHRPDIFQVLSRLDLLRTALTDGVNGGAPPPPEAPVPPPVPLAGPAHPPQPPAQQPRQGVQPSAHLAQPHPAAHHAVQQPPALAHAAHPHPHLPPAPHGHPPQPAQPQLLAQGSFHPAWPDAAPVPAPAAPAAAAALSLGRPPSGSGHLAAPAGLATAAAPPDPFGASPGIVPTAGHAPLNSHPISASGAVAGAAQQHHSAHALPPSGGSVRRSGSGNGRAHGAHGASGGPGHRRTGSVGFGSDCDSADWAPPAAASGSGPSDAGTWAWGDQPAFAPAPVVPLASAGSSALQPSGPSLSTVISTPHASAANSPLPAVAVANHAPGSFGHAFSAAMPSPAASGAQPTHPPPLPSTSSGQAVAAAPPPLGGADSYGARAPLAARGDSGTVGSHSAKHTGTPNGSEPGVASRTPSQTGTPTYAADRWGSGAVDAGLAAAPSTASPGAVDLQHRQQMQDGGVPADVAALRLHVNTLTAQNQQMAARMRQLEETVLSQGVTLQQLVAEVQSLRSHAHAAPPAGYPSIQYEEL